MKQINLLPDPEFLEQYQTVFSTLAALIVLSISSYGLMLYIKWWQFPRIQSDMTALPLVIIHCAQHSIQQLRMIGQISYPGASSTEEFWAIIQAPDKTIVTLKVGDLVGCEHAVVTAVHPLSIQLQAANREIDKQSYRIDMSYE